MISIPKKFQNADNFLRFLKKFLLDDSCWIWIAGKTKSGYGQFSFGGRCRGAHIFSWLYFNDKNEIPTGFEVCHSCHNPSCVRPDHLYLDTHLGNCNARKIILVSKL